MTRSGSIRRIAAGVLASVALAGTASAIWIQPDEVPVERLIRNLEARLREKPDDVQAEYVLGRDHGLALAKKSRALPVWGAPAADGSAQEPSAELPTVDVEPPFRVEPGTGGTPSEPELRKHLDEAVLHLDRAAMATASPSRGRGCEATRGSSCGTRSGAARSARGGSSSAQ